MRFAWLRENAAIDAPPAEQSLADRLILVVYNVVWWVPVVLPIIGVVDAWTGFIGFALVTAIRLVANLYRNNILPPEQGEFFPLRSP
jgi:hypothetical protein